MQSVIYSSGPMLRSLLSGAIVETTIRTLKTVDLLLPVAGLLLSLVLQLVLLFTGQLRRRLRLAKYPGWVAYVGADLVAAYILGLLSRYEQHSWLYGLWAALLVYHLGGPDNFIAYSREDSQLWKRHLANLLLQVAVSAYVIIVNTRGWILAPTLLVFLVGVIRYWERNVALRHSSIKGITKAMTPYYKYMETEGEGEPSSREELNYIVAGGWHWYSTMKSMSRDTGRFNLTDSYAKSRPLLVTTADIEQELNLMNLSDELARWARWLVVANASSHAYLRRVVGLARSEQFRGETRMRKIWFERDLQQNQWMAYLKIEQDYLYNLLYTKPADPDGNRFQLAFRIFSSFAFVGSLLGVYFLAGKDAWQGQKVFQVATYVLLLVGFFVEIGYGLRLLFSKGAVVALLVDVVRTHRAIKEGELQPPLLKVIIPKLRRGFLSVEQAVCVFLLRINRWWESSRFLVMHGREIMYIPVSRWDESWEMMRRAAFPARTDCMSLLESIQSCQIRTMWDEGREMVRRVIGAHTNNCKLLMENIQSCQTDGVASVLDTIRTITKLPPHSNRLNRPIEIQQIPVYSKPCFPFIPFYNSDWEHVLLIWWICTLKVFSLEKRLSEKGSRIDKQIELKCLLTVTEASPDQLEQDQTEVTTASADHQLEQTVLEVGAGPNLEDNLVDVAEANPNLEQESALEQTTQKIALWLMVYVGRLLTVCPELLPTHLELTKTLVADALTTAQKDICNPSNWVKGNVDKIASWEPPTQVRYNNLPDGQVIVDIHREIHSNTGLTADVHEASSQLAVMLLTNLDYGGRWKVLKTSAGHFIASLAQVSKLKEHCDKLTEGGELLTTLWILSSHLGGGQQ